MLWVNICLAIVPLAKQQDSGAACTHVWVKYKMKCKKNDQSVSTQCTRKIAEVHHQVRQLCQPTLSYLHIKSKVRCSNSIVFMSLVYAKCTER